MSTANIESIYPLAPMQEGMLFHDLYERGSRTYFQQSVVPLVGIDVGLLKQACEILFRRHAVLRTFFVWEDREKPIQIVRKIVELPWCENDLTGHDAETQAHKVAEYLRRDREVGFNLEKAPLVRLTLFCLGQSTYQLLWSTHHIILDGWCQRLLLEEVMAHYERLLRGDLNEPPMVRPFRDFIAWLGKQDPDSARQYWRKYLEGFEVATSLPGDRGRAEVSPAPEAFGFSLGRAIMASLETKAQSSGLTISTLVQGCFGLLLAHWGGGEDAVFGQVSAGRPESLPGAAKMIGLFINTLPVRMPHRPHQSILEQLQTYQRQILEMQNFAYVSLADIQAWAQIPRGEPLFEVMIDYQKTSAPIEVAQEGAGSVQRRPAELTEYPFVVICKYNTALDVVIHCHGARVDAASVALFAVGLRQLLLAFLDNPHARLDVLDLPLLTARAVLPVEPVIEPGICSPLRRFEQYVQKTPSATAVTCSGQSLSYAELDRQVKCLATLVRNERLGAEGVTAVCLDPGPHLVVALLAALRAGRPFQLLEPNDPEALAALRQSPHALVLTTAERAQQFGSHALAVDQALPLNSTQVDADRLSDVPAGVPAYFSPGSSTALTLDQLCRRLNWLARALSINPSDRMLFSSPVSSFCSIWELLLPLTEGASVVIARDAQRQDPVLLHELILTHNVSVVQFSPDRLSRWLNASESLSKAPSLRLVVVGGGLLLGTLVKAFERSCSAALSYLYAIPELGEELSLRSVNRQEHWPLVPIGTQTRRPLFLLDRYHRPVAMGARGRLFVGVDRDFGPGSIANPFPQLSEPFLFDTGEEARWCEGELVLEQSENGRFAWIQGQRVSLCRVEASLLATGKLTDAWVSAWVDDQGVSELIAFVVGWDAETTTELEAALRAFLPASMVPGVVIPLANLPRLHDGSLDEALLKTIDPIDNTQIARWQSRLAEVPGIQSSTLIALPRQEQHSRLHLDDLLPNWDSQLKSESDAVSVDSEVVESAFEPSIIHGPAFEMPADAPKTLQQALIRTAERHPSNCVVLLDEVREVRLTYVELLDQAKRVLSGLRAMGLKRGDCVILQIDDYPLFFPTFWGCLLAGVIPVTVAIAPTYREDNAVVSKLANTWSLLDGPPILVNQQLQPALMGLKSLKDMQGLRTEVVETLLRNKPCERLPEADPEDLAFYQLSSGSTGVPKCIQITQRGVIWHAFAAKKINPTDVSLNWLPLDHVGPIIMVHLRDVIMGCTSINAVPAMILSNPLRWLALIEKYRVTFTWAPNFAFKLVADQLEKDPTARFDLSCIKTFLNGGEQVTQAVARNFLRRVAPFGIAPERLQPAFGMAETCTAITFNEGFSLESSVLYIDKASLNGRLRKVAPDHPNQVQFIHVGPPMPGVSLRIVDDSDRLLPMGTIGRFQVKGPVTTPGYLKNDAVNLEALRPDGWFNTGDLGCLIDGNLTITGREKDIIIVNGANFYCYEIEDMVGAMDGVKSSFVAACGVLNKVTGTESLAIFFVPEKETFDFSEIQDLERQIIKLTGVAPSHIVPLKEAAFPKTTSGKIQRAQLKKDLEQGHYQVILREIDLHLANARTLPDWFFTTRWRREQILNESTLAGIGLLFVDEQGLCDGLVGSFTDSDSVIRVEQGPFARLDRRRFRIDPADRNSYHSLLELLAQDGLSPRWIVHAWTYAEPSPSPVSLTIEERFSQGAFSIIHLIQALSATTQNEQVGVRLLAVSSHSQALDQDEMVLSERGALVAMLKTAQKELPWLKCRHLDLPLDQPETQARWLWAELTDQGTNHEVAYRSGKRWVAFLEKVDFGKEPKGDVPFKNGGLYLLSGGLGGIGTHLATYLHRQHAAKLILLGRTELPERSAWPTILAKGGPVAERIQALLSLEQSGQVRYHALDSADRASLRAAVDSAVSAWGQPLDGVVNMAGVYRECLLVDETPESLVQSLHPRVNVSQALLEQVADRPGSLYLSFSSVNGFFGGYGVSAYALGSSFLDHFTREVARRKNLRAVCLAWSLWEEVGMSRGLETAAFSRGRGFFSLTPQQGIQSMLISLRCPDQNYWFIGLDGEKTDIRRQTLLEQPSERQLHCFYTTADGRPRDLSSLKVETRFASISRCQFHHMAELPVDSSGQIDHAALIFATKHMRKSAAERVLPKTEAEQKMLEIWKTVFDLDDVDMNDDFFALGGHSLLSVRIADHVRRQFGVSLPLRQLLEKPTVAGFVATVNAAQENMSTENVEPEVVDMASEVMLANEIWPPSERVDFADHAKAIFLTGATGFVGVFLLKALLDETSARVYCLVRATNAAMGLKRILEGAAKYGLEIDSTRVEAVPGDLGRPRMGIEEGLYARLANMVDVIYHCGSLVQFQFSYNMLKPSAVFGTQEALRLAVEGRLKAFHFISTIGVLRASHNYRNGVVREDDELENWSRLNAGYVQSKWVAEGVTKIAMARGIPVAIYRLGAISGDSRTGKGDMGSSLMRRLRTFIDIGAAPIHQDPWDMMPADYVAKAVVHLSRQSNSVGKAFHLENRVRLDHAVMMKEVTKLGYPIKLLSPETWTERLRERLEQGEELAIVPLLGLEVQQQQTQKTNSLERGLSVIKYRMGLSQEKGKNKLLFDQSNVRQGLQNSNLVCPEIKHLLPIYLKYLVEANLIKPRRKP